MINLRLLCLLAAVMGLACSGNVEVETSGAASNSTPSPSTGGGGTGTEQTSSTGEGGGTTPTGAGGAAGSGLAGSGGVAASGGVAGSGGVGGSSGAGGDTGPCVEPGPYPMYPGGSNGVGPSKCHCADEVEAILALFAAGAKAHHDIAGQSCISAVTVPFAVPAGVYYVPGWGGVDFLTGDEDWGWKCLDVEPPTLIHCRYSYTRGGSPVASYYGAPVVATGPDDFEVAGEGDADADAVTSAFSIVGTVGPDGQILLHPMFIHQPLE